MFLSCQNQKAQYAARCPFQVKGSRNSLSVPSQATPSNLSATIRVKKKTRPSLKEFKAKQVKKGVSYRISKSGKRKTINGAFINQKMGGHVFKRKTKARFPLSKMHGVSVWGVYEVNDLLKHFTQPQVEAELSKQIKRRLDFNIFKKKKKLGLV